jgi:hypothetical protein
MHQIDLELEGCTLFVSFPTKYGIYLVIYYSGLIIVKARCIIIIDEFGSEVSKSTFFFSALLPY